MKPRSQASMLTIAVLFAAGCGASPLPAAPPVMPSPVPTPSPSTLNVSGAWHGNGSDPQGDELLTWTLTQDGTAITGSADLKPANTADGSCASCHKFKSGTLTGTVSGDTLRLNIVFPAGGDGVPTPMCTITFDATASASNDHIAASYTGEDTCEGAFSGGTLTMDRAR